MTVNLLDDALKAFAKGRGALRPWLTHSGVAVTAVSSANVQAGSFSILPLFNNLGTTAPGTLVGLSTPDFGTDMLANLTAAIFNNAARQGMSLAYLYKIGTVDLTGTGDRFTHDASATFPVLRKQMGVASKPVTLIPMVYITTALTVTAAAFRLQTAAGASGYTDQDGNATIGTKTFTFPSATAVAQSAYIPVLEDGDTGLRDINAVRVDTAATAGACTMYGMEIISGLGSMGPLAGNWTIADMLYGSLRPHSLKPAVPTSGTLTSHLVLLMWAGAAATGAGWYSGYGDA